MERRSLSVQGLPNDAGTACHVSSAVVLLFYAVPPVREILLKFVTHALGLGECIRPGEDQHWRLIFDLGCLFYQLAHDCRNDVGDHQKERNESVTPHATNTEIRTAPFYRILSEYLHVRADDVGDAVTCLSKLVYVLSNFDVESQVGNRATTISKIVASVVQAALGTGILTSRIEGVYDTSRRVKEKHKTLPCPLTLSVETEGVTTLNGLLQKFGKPTVLEGYQWVEGTFETVDFTGDIALNDQGNDDISFHSPIHLEQSCLENNLRWKTIRQEHIKAMPPWWFLHLDGTERRHTWSCETDYQRRRNIQIPWLLNVSSISTSSVTVHNSVGGNLYTLVGAILHTDSRQEGCSAQNDDEERENGHYVTLIPCPKHRQADDENPVPPSRWFLIDDDEVSLLHYEGAMELLTGSHTLETISLNQVFSVVVLAYQRLDALDTLSPVFESACDEMEKHFNVPRDTSTISSVHPDTRAMVGRRLRIRWAKGKYYAGTITDYSALDGKHTVQYDDGDVRRYHLSKKTIEWETEL